MTLEGTSMLKSKLSLPQLPNLPKFGQSSRPGKNTTSGKNQSKNQQQTSGIPDPTPNFDKQLQHVESIEIITHPNIFVPLANGLAELQLPKNPFGEVPEEQNIKDKDDDIYTVPVAITQTVESKNNSVLAKPVNVQVDRDLPLPAHVPTASTGLGSGGSLTQPSKPEKHGSTLQYNFEKCKFVITLKLTIFPISAVGGALTTANSIGYATGDNATANTLVANQIELSNSKVVITGW